MRARFLLPCVLLLLATAAQATDPPAPSIDEQINKLVAARKQLEADKATVAAIEAELKLAAKSLQDKLAALGITVDPPEPVDPLKQAVADAYAKDPSVGKDKDRVILATVYREIAKSMPSIGTTDGLFSVVQTSTRAQLADRLGAIRPLIGADFAKHIPAGSVALTAEHKAEASKTLERYATILEGLK
jgi:hypothetical protein